MARTHLEDVVAHLEHDGALHAVILDEELHVLGALDVVVRPLDVAPQRLGHVVLEVSQEVRLALKRGGDGAKGVVPPRVDVGLAVGDVVKVPAGAKEGGRVSDDRETGEGTAPTHSLSGLNTIVVESLKYRPDVPSVKLYAVPYLCV